jgi:hypothetical protein
MQTLDGPATWRCGHLYQIVVSAAEGGKKRARCLGCEATGPLRAGAPEAMRALREEGKTGRRRGPKPPLVAPGTRVRGRRVLRSSDASSCMVCAARAGVR